MHIIDLSTEDTFILALERAHYETMGRENIINFMISNGMTSNSNYQNYWEEYLVYLRTYNQLKEDLQIQYIRPKFPNFSKWNVDFNKKVIEVYD